MRRIVYEVERVTKTQKNEEQDSQVWLNEKRTIALKLISNASVLSDAVSTCKMILEKNPDAELKSAVAKIDEVIEELRVDFKKNYVI